MSDESHVAAEVAATRLLYMQATFNRIYLHFHTKHPCTKRVKASQLF